MPNIPCRDAIRDCDCIEDSPFKNLSAEAPDLPVFVGKFYLTLDPLIGLEYGQTSCFGVCESTVSQADADACAYQAALLCIGGDWRSDGGGPGGPPVPPAQSPLGRIGWRLYFNDPQSASVNCPDGLPFVYTVPAGRFAALGPIIVGANPALVSQARAAVDQANRQALAAAQSLAQQHLLCLSDIASRSCVGQAYNQTIIASTSSSTFGASWSVSSGDLPTGMEFSASGGQATISGTPTESGVFTFTVSIQLSNGDFFDKTYSIGVMGIDNADTLPDGTVGNSYQVFLIGVGVTNPIYSLESGVLPDGLSLDTTGVIFGTPTVDGDFDFSLGITEAGTGITCVVPAAITIEPGCTIDPTPLPDGQEGVFYAQALTAPAGFVNPVWSMAGGTHLPPGFDETVLTGFGFLFANACEQAGTFSFKIRVDGDGGMTCTQTKSILVTPRVPVTWNISWPAPQVDIGDGGGSESHTLLPASLNVSCHSGNNVGAFFPSAHVFTVIPAGRGTFLYTGPNAIGKLTITNSISALLASTGWSVEVFQDGVSIGEADNTNTAQGTVILFVPFTAGVASVIRVGFSVLAATTTFPTGPNVDVSLNIVFS